MSVLAAQDCEMAPEIGSAYSDNDSDSYFEIRAQMGEVSQEGRGSPQRDALKEG